MKREDHEIKWYEHEVIHYEDQRGSDHKTKERYHIIVEEDGGYVPDEGLTPEEFTKLANKDSTEVETSTQTKRLTGATRATQDIHMETAYITTTKVKP